MRELYGLLEYINYYQYDEDDEEIKIIPSPYEKEAKEQYDIALHALGVRIVEPDDDAPWMGSFFGGSNKWHLDVAIGCVRQMDENDRDYVVHHLQTTEYHFGYAMGLRNKYIHPSKKHHCFDPDGESSKIMEVIFSILHRGYDFRNSLCTDFFESFSYNELFKQYGESESDVFAAVEDRIFNKEKGLTVEDSINILKESLLKKLGKKEFKRILKECVKEYTENGWNEDDFHWSRQFPAKAVLYPREAKQALCLRNLGLFREVELMRIKDADGCKKYIDDNLGLQEEYALFMAGSIWEACNPISTGGWRKLTIYTIGLGYRITSSLKESGIETLGALYGCSPEKLQSLEHVTEQDVETITEWFNGVGLQWPHEKVAQGYRRQVIITVTEDDLKEGMVKAYENFARMGGFEITEKSKFRVTELEVSKEINEYFWKSYSSKAREAYPKMTDDELNDRVALLMIQNGPKTNETLLPWMVAMGDDFVGEE